MDNNQIQSKHKERMKLAQHFYISTAVIISHITEVV
jgi:hypothetical protein